MTLLNQKKLLVLFSFLLFAGFLFFIPQRTYAASVFTAGWYQDIGSGETDASCPAGYWRASIELRDDLGEPLLVDALTVRALWYEEGTDIGVEIYRTDAANLASHIFETDCAIDMKDNTGTVVLEVTAEKAGYYKMLAANNPIRGGSALDQKKWKKTLYLASFERIQNPNIVYLFPDNNQWISAREEHSEMKIWINKAPLPDNITQVNVEIIHMATGQKFSLSQAANIAEGEVIFDLLALTQQGYYSWQVKLTRSTPSIFYNENEISFFNFDPNPPFSNQLYGLSFRSGKLQAPYFSSQFKDEPLPSSGICTIELYLNDGPSTPFGLVNTCTGSLGNSAWCTYLGPYQEYLTSKTYTGYVIAYDCAGNRTQTGERSFTISPLSPSVLTILSSVDQAPVTGAPFQVTNVYNVINGTDTPAIGDYQTATSFFSTADSYNITLQAPNSYNERPFSFWAAGQNCYANPLTMLIPYGSTFTRTMNFGVSRFMLGAGYPLNLGTVSNSLLGEITNKITKVEQIGGSPADLLGPTGYFNLTSNNSFNKTVTGEINNLVLKFYDSADGILKFSTSVYNSGWSCALDPNNPRQCQGSIIYGCGRIYPYYLIQRTVRVETYLGNNLVGGVGVSGSGGMQSGTTTADGYYTFSSTAQPDQFTGYLRAPEFIIDNNGKKVEFGYWEGCESVSADKLGCYIGTGVTWFYDVNTTVKAYNASEPDPEMPFLSIDRILTGGGDGTVTSPSSGICCGCVPTSICSNYFITSTLVTLTANPVANSYFVGWTGACSGTNPTCTISMDSYREVWAEFALKPVLTVNITGNGTVTSTPPDIDCDGPTPIPSTCSTYFDPDEDVELTANPDSNWEFIGWTGACTGTGNCSLTMNEDKIVTATFKIKFSPPADLGENPDYCWGNPLPVAPGTAIIFSWVYDPVHVYPQDAYEIWISDSDGNFATTAHTSLSSNYVLDLNDFGNWKDTQCDHSAEFPAFGKGLCWSNTYYWKVKVKDNQGNWSNFSNQSSFEMPAHAWPWVDFNPSPERPTVGEIVEFTDNSSCYNNDGDVVPCINWDWVFQNGNPLASNSQNATTTFTSIGLKTVTLTVTDSDGFFCSDSKSVQIDFSLPKWKEVPPTF